MQLVWAWFCTEERLHVSLRINTLWYWSATFVNVSMFKENDSQCFNVPLSHTVLKKQTHFLGYNSYQVKPLNISNLYTACGASSSNDCATSSLQFLATGTANMMTWQAFHRCESGQIRNAQLGLLILHMQSHSTKGSTHKQSRSPNPLLLKPDAETQRDKFWRDEHANV